MNVTIGMPIYNAGDHLRETLECLLKFNCPIVISDNNSTDNTQEICQEYVLKYNNILYTRLNKTIGAVLNYKNCVEQANTEYFMLITGRDLVDDNYIDVLVKELEKEKKAVLAYTQPKFFEKDIKDSVYLNVEDLDDFEDLLLSEDKDVRLIAYIKYNVSCMQQFGIYRTDFIKRAFKACENDLFKYGSDYIFLAKLSEYGKMIRTKETNLYRRRNLNRPEIPQLVKYITYYPEHFNNQLMITNIYEEYFLEVYKTQLAMLKESSFENPEISNLNLELIDDSLKKKFMNIVSPWSLKEFSFEYLEKYNSNIYTECVKNKRIVIYGAGPWGWELYKSFKEENTIIGFIDHYKQGEFNGFTIKSKEWLIKYRAEYDYIVCSVEGNQDLEIMNEINGLLEEEKMISWKNCVLYSEYKRNILGYKS